MSIAAPTRPATGNRGQWPVVVLGIVVTAALAAVTGISAASGSKSLAILPVAAGGLVLLLLIGALRFDIYVCVLLALRSSIDLTKLSGTGAAAGTTGTTRGLDPSSLLAVTFILSAAVWLGAQRRRNGRLQYGPLGWSLMAFGGAVWISVLGASNIGDSALNALRFSATVVMFLVLEQLLRNGVPRLRLLVAAGLSLLFPLAYTFGGYAIGSPPVETKGSFLRVTGTFGQSNAFGRFLMLATIFGIAVWPHIQRRWRLIYTIVLVASMGCLLLTYTRTAIIGAVLGLLVVAVAKRSGGLLVSLVVVGICALLLVPQLASRFSSLGSGYGDTTAGDSGNSLAWRLGYWTEVLPLADANPVTGIGFDMTQYSTDVERQPHNDWLRAYVETGLIGLLSYWAMLFWLVRSGWKAVRGSPYRSTDRAIAAGYLGCAVAFVAASLAANIITNVAFIWYLFTLAAIATVRPDRQDDRVIDLRDAPAVDARA